MSAIDDLIAAWTAAFPRYVNAGIASSGPGEPKKLLVMELGQKIADAISAASGGDGTLAYATVADMNADLDHDANTQAAVYADSGGDTTNHNGIWTKVGASGTGSWTWLRALSIVELGIRLDALEAIDAENRLTALEDTTDANAPLILAYRREMIERPGDAPELFADAYTGTPDASTKTSLSPATVTNGKALQLSGAHILARRGWVRIEPNRKYLVRAIAQRATDPVDPLGDAVELGMAWFTNAGAAVSGTPTSVLGTFSALTVASGRTQKQAIVGTASGDDITVVAPAGAVYGRAYVQSYGLDGLTNIEALEVKDVTDAIGDSIAQSLVDDAISAAATVQAVETTVQGLRDDAVAAAAAAASDMWSRPVLDVTNTPPGSPSIGDRHLAGTSPTGAWSAHANEVAEWDGSAWLFSGAPLTGQTVQISGTDAREFWTGTAWRNLKLEDIGIETDVDGVSNNVHIWINDKLGNIFDYIPPSIDHDDIRAGAETSDLSSYIVTAYGSRPLLEWGDGVFYTSQSIDLTALDGGALIGCGANFGPTYDLDGGSGTRIIITGSNIPGVRLMNASTLRDVAIRYETEQAAANTAAIGVELNNWNRGHIDNLLVSGAAISVGVPQANAPGKSYNSYWNSKIGTVASYNASLGHFDLRPYNAGVTNVVIDNLNLNGAGSVDDFTTPGKSCTYGVKALNLSGLKIGQINLESLTLTGPALDVSSGRNTFSIDQLRMETVSFEAASGTPILKFGGSYNRSRIEGMDIQYVRWMPSGSAPGSGDSLYIIQTNATINQLFVPIYLRSTCDFGGTGTRRVLTNSCSDFTASDIEVPYYDEGSQLSDGSWTDSVTTRQSPVRKIGGYAAYEKFRSGRNTNYLTRYYANSSPAAADGTFAIGDEWVIRGPAAGAVSKYRCTTAGVVGSGGAFTATEAVPLVGTATFDPASLATGTQTSVQTMTVTGATLGMKVARKSFSLDLQGCALEAYVSATNTVSYFIRNGTAGTVDLASGTVTVEVVP